MTASVAATGLLLALAAAGSNPGTADLVRIDGPRSRAEFSLRVAWLRPLRGRFATLEGQIEPDGDASCRVSVQLHAHSLAMRNPAHTAWARSAEFFAADAYPFIRFEAAGVPLTRLLEGGDLEGQLSLRSVQRPVLFKLLPATCTRPGFDCPLRARGEVRRSEFGMNSRHWILSDKVKLRFSFWFAGEP